MYFYCNRTKMSAAGPGAEGPQSCGEDEAGGGGGGGGEGGGGGCGELLNGNGDRELSEARAISEWESATCDLADGRGKSAEGAKSWKCIRDRCGRQTMLPAHREAPAHSGGGKANGGVRGTAAAVRTTTRTGLRALHKPDAAVSKRRGCSFSRASKRACFSGTAVTAAAGLLSEIPAGKQQQVAESFLVNPASEEPELMKNCDGGSNGEKRVCRTAKGRVRFYRVQSFLTASDRINGNGVAPQRPPCLLKTQCNNRPRSPPCPLSENPETSSFTTNGSPRTRAAGEAGGAEASGLKQVEEAQGEARKRQVQLEQRTDTLWRRLHAMQVKQLERHVTQQLGDLRQATATPSAAELNRLARSCSEVLRTAEGALDSDHTASSSGSSSDSEEEDEEDDDEEEDDDDEEEEEVERRGSHTSTDWQWMRERAWLGSRWVWLQAQVSELEYRIRALTALYTHLRQGKLRAAHSVPETPLRAPRPSPASGDCRKKLEEPAPSSQMLPNPTSSSARVRPLLRQRRHRLIRLAECTALASKVVTLPCCCEPPAVCVLCAPPRSPAERDKFAGMHRTGQDHCVHPVLSMPSDFPLPFNHGEPPLAGPQSHGAMGWMSEATSSWLGKRGQGSQRAGRARRRLMCPHPPNTLPPLFNMTGSNYRSQRSIISPGYLPQRVADLSSLPAPPPASDTPTQRRRRGESSFDIDNLIMPLGLAGLGARVQKLQYKEIITPSWRELDSVCGALEKRVVQSMKDLKDPENTHQLNGERHEDNCDVEDLSDAAFLKRHAVWENRERSRWGSWARRRRRGRSSDGKNYRGLEQASCSPEPRQGKSSPCSPLCSGVDDLFYQMEDEQQAVQPWERRSFPLLEAELRWLQEDEEADPEEDACAASGRSQSTDSGISVGSLELSPRTPQPHQQHSGGRKPATSTTQDSDSLAPFQTLTHLLSSQLSSLPSPSTHQTTSIHRASKTNTPLL